MRFKLNSVSGERWFRIRRRRFTIRSKDGKVWSVSDRGRVIARGIGRPAIQAVIAKRMKLDAWRGAVNLALKRFNGGIIEESRRNDDPWHRRIHCILSSWNNRSDASVKAIRYGKCAVREELFVNARHSSRSVTWDQAVLRVVKVWNEEPKDEWYEWCQNVVSNHRKRMRRKRERGVACGEAGDD